MKKPTSKVCTFPAPSLCNESPLPHRPNHLRSATSIPWNTWPNKGLVEGYTGDPTLGEDIVEDEAFGGFVIVGVVILDDEFVD